MSNYTILDHTADIGLKAEGKTLQETFANAAKGLFAILVNGPPARPERSVFVEIEAESPEELLVAWLNKLIFVHDSEKLVPCRFDISEFERKRLTARIWGETLDFKKHEIQTYVKAATYHGTKIESGKLHKVTVYFDV